MDELPNYEFHGIFDRVSSRIDLQGKMTVEDINKELWKSREYSKKRYLQAENVHERTRYKNAVVGYSNLIRYRFANRIVKEALEEPRGFIATTLIFGKIEAKRRLDAQRRSRMRFYRRPSYWKRY